MRRRAALTPLLLCLALLGGCGGGGNETDTTTGSHTQASTTESKVAKKQSEGKQEPSGSPAAAQDVSGGEPVPGSKAVAPGVPTTKGADNSIEEFGTEGEEDPRNQAVANLTAYLDSLRAGDWDKACSLASREYRRQLAQLIAQAEGKDKPSGCPETLGALLDGASTVALGSQLRVDAVLSFRIEAEHAYLIYRGTKRGTLFVAMANDDGKWKVNVLQPEQLPTAKGQ